MLITIEEKPRRNRGLCLQSEAEEYSSATFSRMKSISDSATLLSTSIDTALRFLWWIRIFSDRYTMNMRLTRILSENAFLPIPTLS